MSATVRVDDWKPTLAKGCVTGDAVPRDSCWLCGQGLWLDTDGDGQLVAKDLIGGADHLCPGAELGQGTIEAQMAESEMGTRGGIG